MRRRLRVAGVILLPSNAIRATTQVVAGQLISQASKRSGRWPDEQCNRDAATSKNGTHRIDTRSTIWVTGKNGILDHHLRMLENDEHYGEAKVLSRLAVEKPRVP
jgi:hypothetical protein